MDTSRPTDLASVVELVKGLLPTPLNAFISAAEREQAEVDGVTTLLDGFPQEVVVRITEQNLSVGVFAAHWEGPCDLKMFPEKIASFNWRRIPLQVLEPMVRQAIEAAQQIRRSRFRRCDTCGELMPPESMHDKITCQTCAQPHLGVIY